MKSNPTYHAPVLLKESIDALNIQADGTYVDVTFGGGGHSRAILERLGPNGRLYGLDQDPDAANNIIEDERFKLLPFNFQYLKKVLRMEGVRKIDGLLGDLGVSSHQLDTPDRGFSFRFNTPLDMRMSQSGQLTAQKILNTYTQEQLQSIFGQYGEIRNARTLSQCILKARDQKKIRFVADLLQVIEPVIRGKRNKYLSQLFQALRIEVNGEIEVLKSMLLQAVELLNQEGRLVIITYHSLEEKLIKNLIRNGCFDNEPQKDLYGNFDRPLKSTVKKFVAPSEEEIKENPRARSARMRIAKKLE
ncbi:MAG: 16S rRNA (cytosine(1402)-N(4))-methyltransferase RsmH [Saprospiraceae bacterium]|nr:16S rRNA (cytosine(1402)-N(4))-methyltransferase RsmH [Saprospiraceae bacterium]